MDKEISIIEIDNKEYIIMDVIDNYFYLSNSKDENDFFIKRKVGNELDNLKDEEEFKKAMELFLSKNKELLN